MKIHKEYIINGKAVKIEREFKNGWKVFGYCYEKDEDYCGCDSKRTRFLVKDEEVVFEISASADCGQNVAFVNGPFIDYLEDKEEQDNGKN